MSNKDTKDVLVMETSYGIDDDKSLERVSDKKSLENISLKSNPSIKSADKISADVITDKNKDSIEVISADVDIKRTDVAEPDAQNKPSKKVIFKNKMSSLKNQSSIKLQQAKTKYQNYEHVKVDGLAYVNRDPEEIHSELKVMFKDVIAEPEGVHSFNTVWGTSHNTYSKSKFWFYRFLTAILGIPFALFWALYFSILAFLNIWFVVPFVKAFIIQMRFMGRIWGVVISTFLDPLFRSIGLVLNNVKIRVEKEKEMDC